MWDEIKDQRLDGSPSNWSWQQVQKWLYENNLWIMYDTLNESFETDKDGIDGAILLDLNKEKLERKDYQVIDQLEEILAPELFPGRNEKSLTYYENQRLVEKIMKIIDVFLCEVKKLRS
eukprot:23670_1